MRLEGARLGGCCRLQMPLGKGKELDLRPTTQLLLSLQVLPPPDNFLLMLLWPEDVDYLRLRDNYRQVDRKAGDEWDITPVFP